MPAIDGFNGAQPGPAGAFVQKVTVWSFSAVAGLQRSDVIAQTFRDTLIVGVQPHVHLPLPHQTGSGDKKSE